MHTNTLWFIKLLDFHYIERELAIKAFCVLLFLHPALKENNSWNCSAYVVCWLKTFFSLSLKPHYIYFSFGLSVWEKRFFCCGIICFRCGLIVLLILKGLCVHSVWSMFVNKFHSLTVIEKENKPSSYFFPAYFYIIIKVMILFFFLSHSFPLTT